MSNPLVLRPTAVQTYLSCPRKFFFANIENAPRVVSAALAIGTAFHKGAEVLVSALKARRNPTEVLKEAETTYEEALEFERTLGDPDPEDDRFDTAKDTGIGLVRALANGLPTDWQPAQIEATVAAQITPEITLRGTTDLVLTDGTPDQPRNLAIVEVTKTKVPAVHIHPTERTPRNFEVYRDIVTKVARGIQAGIDPPAPSSWCGGCPHRSQCPINQ